MLEELHSVVSNAYREDEANGPLGLMQLASQEVFSGGRAMDLTGFFTHYNDNL